MKKFILFALFAPALLWSCGGGESTEEKTADDGKIEINNTAPKGRKWAFTYTRTEEVTGMNPMTKQQSTDNNSMIMDMDCEVLESNPDGGYTAKMVNVRMRTEFTMAGQTLKFDSNEEIDPKLDPMMKEWFEGMKAAIGKTTTVTFDKKGKVTAITGDTTYQEMMFPDPNYSMFDNLREMIDLDAVFPAEKVKVGDTWNFKGGIRSSYPMLVDNKVTLSKRENGKIWISVEGTVTPNDQQIAMPDFSGGEMRMNLSGTRKGTYDMNEDGWFNLSENTYDLTGESIMIDPKTQKENKYPMTLKYTDKMVYTIKQ